MTGIATQERRHAHTIVSKPPRQYANVRPQSAPAYRQTLLKSDNIQATAISNRPKMTDTLVKVENVSKKFCRSLKRSLWYGMQDLGSELIGHRHGGDGSLRPDEFWAIKNVSFELKRGECLGLIGRNGAGKTTLLRMLNGLVKPDAGRIEIRGHVGALIALGAGFNPILTGRENVYVNAAVLGRSKKGIDAKFNEIVEFAELEDFIDAPVQTYSSGMTVRLGFSIAATLEPDVLFIDEVLAVGDSAFRIKCYNKIMGLRDHVATIFVSHSMPQVAKVCTCGLLLAQHRSARARQSVSDAIHDYFENTPSASTFFEGVHSANINAIRIAQGDLAASVTPPWPPQPRHIGELNSNARTVLSVAMTSFEIATPVMAIWSITDIDQRLVAQAVTTPITLSLAGEYLELVTQIDSLQLNTGRYTLSVHLFASNSGARTHIVGGLRDILSFSIARDSYMGPASILYSTKCYIATGHGE